MNYVEQTAYSILTANDVRTLPVDTVKLARRLGYTVSPYSAAKETLRSLGLGKYTSQYSAFTIVIDKQASIFYSDDLTPTKRAHVIAHEIGHLQFDFDRSMASHTPHLIGHAEDQADGQQQEDRADEFGRYLTAPLPALDQCRINSALEIENLTGYGPADAKEIYADLIAYRSRKAEMEELLQTQKRFRRFGHTRWFSSHRQSIAIFLLIGVIILLCVRLFTRDVTHPANAPLPTSSATSLSEPAELESQIDTVFVTPSGEKYHYSGCYYIKDKSGLTELSPSEAEGKGYEPCKVCGK